MRILNAAVGAALLILVASPALAGGPRGGGGGHPGGGCGSGCGGGGHPSPAPPPHGGGYNGNINVNVNANANAYAGASAGGYFNARTYDMSGFRGSFGGGGYGGGTVYVGGGYGGDGGGYHGGGPIYNEEVYEGRTCASAPFGYVVAGFGRNGRRAPACNAGSGGCQVDVDRGGRYGYSERHSCGVGRREEVRVSYEESRSYERREEYREESSWSDGYRGGQSHDCGCDHYGVHDAPYPPAYIPEPPRYEPPAPPARPYRPERPRPSQPPRQHYSQEPGERG